jgi:protein-disulfide isomerase
MRLRVFAEGVAVAAVFLGSVLAGSAWRASTGAVTQEPFDGWSDLDQSPVSLTRGMPGAPVVHVFSDYECIACAAFEREVGPALRQLADAGRLRIVIHDAPLAAHQLGAVAAAAMHCAAGFGDAWAMHGALYTRANEWKLSRTPSRVIAAIISESAGNSGPSTSELETCMVDEGTQLVIGMGRRRARELGIDEVPAVIADGSRLRFTSWRALRRHVESRITGP